MLDLDRWFVADIVQVLVFYLVTREADTGQIFMLNPGSGITLRLQIFVLDFVLGHALLGRDIPVFYPGFGIAYIGEVTVADLDPGIARFIHVANKALFIGSELLACKFAEGILSFFKVTVANAYIGRVITIEITVAAFDQWRTLVLKRAMGNPVITLLLAVEIAVAYRT